MAVSTDFFNPGKSKRLALGLLLAPAILEEVNSSGGSGMLSLLVNVFAVHPGRTAISTLAVRAPPPAGQLSGEAESTTSERLVELTEEFLDTGTGFYSGLRPELMAEDFVFRGGVVGPLSKTDYCRTMELLGIADAWKLEANAFGFVVDPAEPMTVRFFLRNTGEHVGAWQPWGAVPPIPIKPTPGKTSVVAPTETGRLCFDAEGKVRHFATGLVVGKYEAQQGRGINTNGLGAVLGLFHTVGLGAVGNLALSQTVRDLSNAAADRFEALKIPKTKTNDEDVPGWWRE